MSTVIKKLGLELRGDSLEGLWIIEPWPVEAQSNKTQDEISVGAVSQQTLCVSRDDLWSSFQKQHMFPALSEPKKSQNRPGLHFNKVEQLRENIQSLLLYITCQCTRPWLLIIYHYYFIFNLQESILHFATHNKLRLHKLLIDSFERVFSKSLWLMLRLFLYPWLQQWHVVCFSVVLRGCFLRL